MAIEGWLSPTFASMNWEKNEWYLREEILAQISVLKE